MAACSPPVPCDNPALVLAGRVQLDLDAAGSMSGLVEYRTAGLGDVEHVGLGSLQEHGQPWVGGQAAQRRGVPAEDHGVQLGCAWQQYPCRGIRRSAQRHSRLALPAPSETLLGLPARGGASVYLAAAGAGGKYDPGAGDPDAVPAQADQQQPDRARRHEVVEQTVHSLAGLCPGLRRQRTERHRDRRRPAVTGRHVHPLRPDRGGHHPTVPGCEPFQESAQPLGLHLHRAPTGGKLPGPAHQGTLARSCVAASRRMVGIGDSCRLTVTHDQLREGANEELYGGWPMILSGLKTWLETGRLLTTPGSLLYG